MQDDRKYVQSNREGMYDDLAYYEGQYPGQGRGRAAAANRPARARRQGTARYSGFNNGGFITSEGE